jgi:hypothetical protein
MCMNAQSNMSLRKIVPLTPFPERTTAILGFDILLNIDVVILVELNLLNDNIAM